MSTTVPVTYHCRKAATYEDSRFPGVTKYYGPQYDADPMLLGYDTRIKVDNPNWRVDVAKGIDASNPYTRSGYARLRPGDGGCEVLYPLYGSDYIRAKDVQRSFSLSNPSFPSRVDNVVRDQALTKLKRKLNSHTEQVNALVPLGELREMRGFIRATAELTETTLKALLTAQMRKDPLKYASEMWLNYKFGVKPLLADTRNIATSLAAYQHRSDRRVRIYGSAQKDWISSSSGSHTGTYGANCHYLHTLYNRVSYRFIGAYDILIQSANDYTIAKHLGLREQSLIPAFWELVPYSWIVDYFTTVGAFLDDVFMAPAGTLGYLVEDRLYKCSVQSNFWYEPWSGAEILSQTPGQGTYTFFEFERTPLSTLPHTMLRLRTMDEIGYRAIDKVLNLAALLITRSKSLRAFKSIGAARGFHGILPMAGL